MPVTSEGVFARQDGVVVPPRVLRELKVLAEGGQVAEYWMVGDPVSGKPFVIYRELPTAGHKYGLPALSDAIVPVPNGYPGALIDLAGLPVGSPLLPRVKGGTNSQGVFEIDGVMYQLASYHPHNGGGGPAWDQNRFGFHTYVDQLIAWLAHL
jgi:hypothetical protein